MKELDRKSALLRQPAQGPAHGFPADGELSGQDGLRWNFRNKFANERRCLQAVVNQGFQGFIVDGVKASLLNPNLDYYQKIYQKRIPVIFSQDRASSLLM